MRTLIPWQPTGEMNNLWRGMDRLFNDMAGRGLRRADDEVGVRGSWSPAVDILEKQDAIEIRADLPGFKADDVDVSVDSGVLTIRGERKLAETTEGETYHRVERSYGMFERSFTLPNTVELAKIEARFKEGEMLVHLPKREESKPRTVKVEVATE